MEGDKEKEKELLQKPIRTYESDVAEAIERERISTAKVIIAENKRKIEAQAEEKNKQIPIHSNKMLMIILSVILILGGIFGIYYLYSKSPLALVEREQQIIKLPSIIKPDLQIFASVGKNEKQKLAQNLVGIFSSQNNTNGKIVEFIPVIDNSSTTNRITGSRFIDKIDFNMSDTLKRSLLDRWMLGIYDFEGQKTPFIVFTTDFFQNAFAEMLKWESSMPDDLMYILNYKEKLIDESASTTPITSFFNIHGKFHDRIIRNRNVREFIDDNNRLLFLYSFIDKNTIIITTSETTLQVLIDRIEKQTFIR